MAVLGDVHIKVSTEALVSKADAVSQSIRRMEDCFMEMEQIINKTIGYWIGEAGELHRKYYMDERDNIDEMMRRLKEHPKDLTAIAQNLDDTDRQVKETINALHGNILE